MDKCCDPEISDEVSSNNSNNPNNLIIDNKSPPNLISNARTNNYWFNSRQNSSNSSQQITPCNLDNNNSGDNILSDSPIVVDNVNIPRNDEIQRENSGGEKRYGRRSMSVSNKKTLKQISDEELNRIIIEEEKYKDCCEVSSCCKKLVRFEIDSYAIINILPISPYHKEILRRRYSNNIGDYQQMRDCLRFTYRLFQIIISIGSVIVPALLSVHMTEYVQTNDYDVQINIIVLIISIVVSICTHIIHIFKLDEMYHLYAITLEKMKTLWYHYSSLSGPFMGTTHKTSFPIFINMMEEIIINQKFQEYVDSKSDKNKPKKEQDYFYDDLREYGKLIEEYNTNINNKVYEYVDDNTLEEGRRDGEKKNEIKI